MLGTRIIMMGLSHSPLSSAAPPNAEMLCAANHEIPLFWLLPFSSADVTMFPVQVTPDDPIAQVPGSEYPLLISERERALQQLERFAERLAPELSEEELDLIQRWTVFLQAQRFPIIAIDTYEMWSNMQNPAQLSTEITALLERLASGMADPHKLLEELHAQGIWQRNNAIALSGFGW